MANFHTSGLLDLQEICSRAALKSFVSFMPMDLSASAAWLQNERMRRGLTQAELAARVTGRLHEDGSARVVRQQSIDQFEKLRLKSIPDWFRIAKTALLDMNSETREDPYLAVAMTDDSVAIKLLPTFAGLGSGGTGEGDEGRVSFSRDLIERELRAPADMLLAMVAEGNSMEPEFRGGDQILVDTRRTSLAQPGAFCMWDGDGHVIKYLERVPDTEPPRVRVVSANGLYEARERLLEEVKLVGRVVWFGRRVQ